MPRCRSRRSIATRPRPPSRRPGRACRPPARRRPRKAPGRPSAGSCARQSGSSASRRPSSTRSARRTEAGARGRSDARASPATPPSHFRLSGGNVIVRAYKEESVAAGRHRRELGIMPLGLRSLYNGAALSLALIPGLAAAQSAPPPPAPEQSAQSSDQEGQLQEIVVTAQKRTESITKVPISIMAIDQETMDKQGVKDFTDVARLVPGLTFQPTDDAGDNNIAIRGISSDVGSATTGIYIDDTPVQVRPDAVGSNPLPKIFDLDRLEVLRGPQGTLFGAGAEGGAIRFITPEANLQSYSGFARGEIAFTDGDLASREARIALQIGLGRDEANGAPFGTGAEQRALRPTQHFEAVEIEDLGQRIAADRIRPDLNRRVVDIDAGRCGADIRADAADRDIVVAGIVGRLEGQAGHQAGHVG